MLASEPWDALASVPVDAIDASSTISARVGITLVDVDLTVAAGGARLAAALVATDQIFTVASKLARVRLALVDLGLTDSAGIPRVAVASETIVTIDALSSMTRSRQAVVYVGFAGHTSIPRWTFTSIPSD